MGPTIYPTDLPTIEPTFEPTSGSGQIIDNPETTESFGELEPDGDSMHSIWNQYFIIILVAIGCLLCLIFASSIFCVVKRRRRRKMEGYQSPRSTNTTMKATKMHRPVPSDTSMLSIISGRSTMSHGSDRDIMSAISVSPYRTHTLTNSEAPLFAAQSTVGMPLTDLDEHSTGSSRDGYMETRTTVTTQGGDMNSEVEHWNNVELNLLDQDGEEDHEELYSSPVNHHITTTGHFLDDETTDNMIQETTKGGLPPPNRPLPNRPPPNKATPGGFLSPHRINGGDNLNFSLPNDLGASLPKSPVPHGSVEPLMFQRTCSQCGQEVGVDGGKMDENDDNWYCDECWDTFNQ